MTSLRDYFGQIFLYNEDKDAITMSTDVASIASVLRAAQEREAANTPENNSNGDSLLSERLEKLHAQALEQAVDIGLQELNLYALRNDILYIAQRIDNVMVAAGLELYNDEAALRSINKLQIYDVHREVAYFIRGLSTAPKAAIDAAPALATLHTGNDGMAVESKDFVEQYNRPQIRTYFTALHSQLDTAVSALAGASIAHLRTQDSASMELIAPKPAQAPQANNSPKP